MRRNVRPTIGCPSPLAWCCLALATLLLGGAQVDDLLAERRQRVEAMSPAEREKLRRNLERFVAMNPAEQQRLRRTEEQLAGATDGPQLRETMNRYCQWLASLPPYCRDPLLSMEPAKRVKRIKQLVQEHHKAGSRELGGKDYEAVVQWAKKYVTEHEAALLAELPDKRQQIAKLKPAMKHHIAVGAAYKRWLSGNARLHPPISEKELADLRARLSAEARNRLARRPAAEQARTLQGWLRQVVKQESELRRSGGAAMLPGFDEAMADFFEFQLSDQERDRLMSLPAEEMQQRLVELYLGQTRPAPSTKKGEPPAKKPEPPTPKGKPPARPGKTP